MGSQEENMALQDRMIRAFRGEAALFEEVEHDENATTEAIIVVVLGSLSVGIGQALSQAVTGRPGGGLGGIVANVAIVLLFFAVFSGVVYFVGTRFFKAEATWNEVLRTLGYAYTPNVVGIVRVVPVLGPLVAGLAGLWSLYLAFIAIRSALDIDTGKTVGTILISLIPSFIIFFILAVAFVGSMM